jgi:WD40 repeat protein
VHIFNSERLFHQLVSIHAACHVCAAQDVKSIAWHPSKELLASCSYDNSIKLWASDEADWVCVQTLEGEQHAAVC